jgi:hypothetical protein
MIMGQFTGTVVKRDFNNRFGWIKFEPENDEDDDEIYFVWDPGKNGVLPQLDTPVTFIREPDPEKPGSYIATNVRVKV